MGKSYNGLRYVTQVQAFFVHLLHYKKHRADVRRRRFEDEVNAGVRKNVQEFVDFVKAYSKSEYSDEVLPRS